MSGDFDGKFPLGSLLKENTIGLGTFHALDGELVVLNGIGYKVDSNGIVKEALSQEKIPYGALTHFEPEYFYPVEQTIEFNGTVSELDKYIEFDAQFYAIKITGEFGFVKTRSVKKQNKPYPKLVEASKEQSVFEERKISGTIVGIYSPKLFGTVSLSGYHLHFLSDSREFGGHILSFTLDNGTIELQPLDILEQHLPTMNKSNDDFDFQELLSKIDETE